MDSGSCIYSCINTSPIVMIATKRSSWRVTFVEETTPETPTFSDPRQASIKHLICGARRLQADSSPRNSCKNPRARLPLHSCDYRQKERGGLLRFYPSGSPRSLSVSPTTVSMIALRISTITPIGLEARLSTADHHSHRVSGNKAVARCAHNMGGG